MSSRAKTSVIVALVAAAAAGTAVGGALLQDRAGRLGGEVHGGAAATVAKGGEPPALELAVLDRDDARARALRRLERLYETGREEEARERFRMLLTRYPDSVEVAVGAAITAWPKGTLERLEELVARHPASAVARLNLGLALVAEGDVERARAQWREAEQRDPDSPAALRAEDVLNPEMPPGRPTFVPRGEVRAPFRGLPLERRMRALERAAQTGGARAWLRYGSALEQLGRRFSAQRAYDRAVALAPTSLEARVAAAVARFDKDEPSAAFSRLGPLVRRHPRAAVVRFHLGLMLLWLPSVEEARRQLRLAKATGPATFYARQARRVLARLARGD